MQIEKSQNSRPFHKLISIEFVCHGNICRSPMAEFLFKDLVKKRNLENRFYIASAATSREEIGNPVHHGTRNKLRQHGISVSGKYAVQMEKQDYGKYDYILGMDKMCIRDRINSALGLVPAGSSLDALKPIFAFLGTRCV